jgi:hypothetical protein
MFNEAAFISCDENGKKAVISLYSKYGFYVYDNTINNKYSVDLMLSRNENSKPFSFIEVEVRSIWKTPTFPFSTVHIPARKLKYITNKTLGLVYAVVSGNYKYILLCNAEHVDINNTITLDTTRRNQESFINVPLSSFCFYVL